MSRKAAGGLLAAGLLSACGAPAPLSEQLHAPGVTADFGMSGAPTFATKLGHRAALHLSGAGCRGDTKPLGAAKLVASPDRIEYRRPALTEWYVRGPRGIEQGFTLEQSPCVTGELELELSVSGLRPRINAASLEIELVDTLGVARLQYTTLVAVDASGRQLPARMHAEGQTIGLRVDTRDAQFPVVVDPEVWAQQGPAVTLSNAKASDALGTVVAIDGDTLVASSAAGAVVFVRNGTNWAQQGGTLGVSGALAISGDTLAVGVESQTVGANSYQGAVYVFVRVGNTWTQQGSVLTASDGTKEDNFGHAVALSGNTLVVGAYGKSFSDTLRLQGATYVFVRNGTSWSQQAILARGDAGAYQGFGGAVAIDGDSLVSITDFTSKGYFYRRSGTVWNLDAPNPLAPPTWAPYRVALSGSTAAFTSNSLSSYVYTRSGTTWAQQDKALPIGGTSGVIAIAGDALIAGNFVYRRSAGTWALQGPLLTSAGMPAAAPNLALSGRTAVIGDGSATVNGGAKAGAVYVFSDVCTSDADCAAIAYCSAARCVARCTKDAECPAGNFCPANGICTPQLAQGTACSLEAGALCKVANCAICAGGKPCVDGVCCVSACGGVCEACSGLLSGGLNGTCLPVPPDKDPESECPADADPNSCQADGACSGQRSCRRFAKAGSPCGATSCDAGSISGKICNGGGTCEQSKASCAPYTCNGEQCGTECESDDDCDPSAAYCLEGACTDRKRVGEACQSAGECGTGFCVDSICCNQACQGQCEACSTTGECLPVQGPPQGEREACTGDPAVCGGECDGVDTERCSYAPASKVCGKSCEEGTAAVAKCDTRGACDEPKVTSCGGYACGREACLTSCRKDADCSEGFGCSDGKCMGGSACTDDLTASVDLGKKPVSCGAYLCDPRTGGCRTACESVDDCSSGSSCDDTGHCTPARSGAKDSSGCGCRVVGVPERPSNDLASLLLLGMAAAVRRGRRALR